MLMGCGYELNAFSIEGDRIFWELAPSGCSETSFERLLKSKRTKELAVKLIRQIAKIKEYGIGKSCAMGKLRKIDQVQGLYEVKGYARADREMAYIYSGEPPEIVLLFHFRGHQGSSDNIHKEIKRAKPLVRIAANLIESNRTKSGHG